MLGGLLGGSLGAMAGPAALAEQLRAKRKRLLLLFLSGGASQLETWDPKPGTKTGGPYRAIPTSIPGVHISELLPHTAKIAHRLAIVRSVNTKIGDHFLGHYVLQSGRTVPGYPVLGSVAAKLLEQPGDLLPGYVSLRRKEPQAYTDVGDAGFLGPRYEAIKVLDAVPPANLVRLPAVTESTAAARDRLRREADARFLRGRDPGPVDAYGTSFRQAAALMQRRDIFDLDREPARDRERYGSHPFGKHCLLARRLLESGVSCVKVTHHDWDGHVENFHWHEVRCGEFDRTFATLVEDFAERGLLADTLIVIMGEMGRTPKINHVGGRDHWGHSWSVAMTGCGIKPGVVYGKTNADGTQVADGEVNAGHLFHTYLRALGLNPKERHEVGGQRLPIGDPAFGPIQEVLA
jgi:hypothetical protein